MVVSILTMGLILSLVLIFVLHKRIERLTDALSETFVEVDKMFAKQERRLAVTEAKLRRNKGE
jgi:acyl carrier protein phosphodiesterase